MVVSETVLILGVGATAGVGAAVARKFAGAGYDVMIAGRTLEKLDATAAEISAAGGSIESVVADVTSQRDQQRVFEIIRARNEPLSAVIYNAGSNLPIKFSDLSPEQFEDFWRIGLFRCIFNLPPRTPTVVRKRQRLAVFHRRLSVTSRPSKLCAFCCGKGWA